MEKGNQAKDIMLQLDIFLASCFFISSNLYRWSDLIGIEISLTLLQATPSLGAVFWLSALFCVSLSHI